MAENTKAPEDLAREKRQKANSLHSAISHFSMKLRFVENETAIEDQIAMLAKYNDMPTKEEIAISPKILDSYRKEFLIQQYEKYFEEYPEMLDLLRDKKTDSAELNFHGLGVLSILFRSNDEESIKQRHKESVEAYYQIVLPQYLNYLINYIVDNEKWNLTHNNKTAFTLYAEVHNLHNDLLKKHENVMLDIHVFIKDVLDNLIDKIAQAKEAGLDKETYEMLISDKVVNKYVVLRMLINEMAGGGPNMLQMFLGATFKDFSLTDIYNSIPVVEAKLELNEKQLEEMNQTKQMLKMLIEKGYDGGSDSSGCLGILLALVIPASFLLMLL